MAPRAACAACRPRQRELATLRSDAARLTTQLATLRAALGGSCWSPAADDAMAAKRRRRLAESENARLREALRAQSQFLRRLRGLLDLAPPAHADSNWCEFMHAYTRLPQDKALRRAEFAALTSERRLREAMRTLAADTQAMAFAQPNIRIDFEALPDGLSASTTAVYALETTDVALALRAACVAIRDITGVWPEYERTEMARTVVDANAASACRLQYGVDVVRYRGLSGMREELVVGTRVATFYSMVDGCGMLMWDFVDDDELYPLSSDVDIVRCAIGGCLVRLEVCEDGVERVVCRTVCSKKYLWATRGARSCSESLPACVERFLASFQKASRPNGLVFKEMVMQQVAEEEMLLGIAQSAC